MTPDEGALTLHFVLLREPAGDREVWVAQCLEHDIAAQGDTVEDARKDLERMILGEIVLSAEKGRPPLSGIAPAPPAYQALWEQAHEIAVSTRAAHGGGRR